MSKRDATSEAFVRSGATESIIELIKSRRTIPEYAPGELEPHALQTALELATYAPNHKLTQPWQFLRLGPNTRRHLARLSVELKSKKIGKPPEQADIDRSQTKFLMPAELLIAYRPFTADPLTEREDYASMACAIQNMQLYLWALGFGTKWGTGGLIKNEETFKILGLSPKEHVLDGLIWIGKFVHKPAVAKRKPVTDILQSRP